jgi:hypothetical protein
MSWTRREIAAKLDEARARAWQEALDYDDAAGVQPFPEQRRNGGLLLRDVTSTELRGIVRGLDLARRVLGLK